jgi:hypothetical protein
VGDFPVYLDFILINYKIIYNLHNKRINIYLNKKKVVGINENKVKLIEFPPSLVFVVLFVSMLIFIIEKEWDGESLIYGTC